MEEAHEKPRETAFMMNKCKLEMGLQANNAVVGSGTTVFLGVEGWRPSHRHQ